MTSMTSTASTASVFSNVFSQEDIQYLIQLPEVVASKTKFKQEASYDAVYFTIPLTPSIRNSLQTRLGLDFLSVSEIPMRWIKGDITPHIDVGLGSTDFENTYLVYINSNSGEFILDEQSYPITDVVAEGGVVEGDTGGAEGASKPIALRIGSTMGCRTGLTMGCTIFRNSFK
jgi:hypothetical protein